MQETHIGLPLKPMTWPLRCLMGVYYASTERDLFVHLFEKRGYSRKRALKEYGKFVASKCARLPSTIRDEMRAHNIRCD